MRRVGAVLFVCALGMTSNALSPAAQVTLQGRFTDRGGTARRRHRQMARLPRGS